MYDTIIVGSGPAGLSAAIYAKRAGLSMLVIEKNPVSGGQVLNTYEVDNYPGLPGINGFDLGMKFREHADAQGAEFADGAVTAVKIKDPGSDSKAPVFEIETSAAKYESKTVIIASGALHSKLGVAGEEEFSGRGVSYCATCDGAFFRGKTAIVVGGGDVAVEDAIFLARGCSKVYLVHRRHELRATRILQDELMSLPNVEIIWDSIVTEIVGDNAVTGARIQNVQTKETTLVDTAAVFIAVGINPDTQQFEGLVDMDDKGYITAPESCATSVPGIFAAGDARGKRLRQIVTAVADGANAVTSVQDFLVGKS
ncbi:thioredoxin-disulfide reductase [Butyrivibrio sp. MC2013]|uniref:thioredoxin-disulfide reductase n=1 Tax=Butyrivibrio sp. MC2013 TaxID=1280686 RepID=UPI00040DBA34|nr:thioredoxin-disulfide reductase [Butyrivibrio sp. MC2013]